MERAQSSCGELGLILTEASWAYSRLFILSKRRISKQIESVALNYELK
jgi:hypothetical protein